MNRINQNINKGTKDVLSMYYTAGFPNIEDTLPVAKLLEKAGADVIEIGMPYSDPVADGPTIQNSNKQALDNGMTLHLLFEQLEELRTNVTIPVILMGYLNPVLQYGVEAFCTKCNEVGVDGVILPDLPLNEFEEKYESIFSKYCIKNIFLITPQTSEERIKIIDEVSDSFIYVVSSSSTTGNNPSLNGTQSEYFRRVQAMDLKNPTLVGFGISDSQSFQKVTEFFSGAIIGSAFIEVLKNSTNLSDDIQEFVKRIRK